MIKVTENAKSKALQLMKDDGNDGYFIRVGVKGGGCSGLMYELKFDNTLTDSDKSFMDNGIKVVVDKKKFSLSDRDNVRLFRWAKWKRICF